jgi:transposase InsO family protein
LIVFDNDSKFSFPVAVAIRSLNVRPVHTSLESAWQNGVAERWIESCRHDLLDHIIAFDERHLKRLLADYLRYYHEDRTHLGLAKETPEKRVCSMNRS